MSLDPGPAQPLPSRPSLEQQRKRARELLNAARGGQAAAFHRFAAVLPRLAGQSPSGDAASTFSLHEAQLVIARECGFASWPKLKSHINSLKTPITFARYSERARRVLFYSRHEAAELGSPSIETEHILLGLLRDDEGPANRILRAHVSPAEIRTQVESRRVSFEKIPLSVEIPFSAETKRVLLRAADEADRLSSNAIDVEHLLLALLHRSRSVASAILAQSGMHLDSVREELARLP